MSAAVISPVLTFSVLLACNATSPAVAGDEPLTTELVTTGLVRPDFITHAPGDDTRLFIVIQ